MIEDKTRTSKTEEVTITHASVEHIMPREWSDHYPLDGEFIPKEMTEDWFYPQNEGMILRWQQIKEKVQARNRAIHCLGNLTVVTQPLNAAMKNGPFKNKKAALRNSLLLMNRYFDGLETWVETEMERRARVLFETAKELWARP